MWHKPRLMNWVSSLLFSLGALSLMYAAVFVIVHLPIFAIERVRLVNPLQHVTQEQVEFVLKNEMRGNFFTVNLDHMVSAFEKLPWVEEVSLRRRWPDVLEIVLVEHQPLARWGDAALLDAHGQRFSAATDEDLPVFHGEPGTELEMIEGYRRFSTLLLNTGREIDELWLTDRRAWTVRLDNGLTMQLGRDEVDQRLERFVEVFDRTLATLPRLDYVDLRYPNGFAVRMKASDAPAGMRVGPQKKPAATTAKPGARPAAKPAARPAAPGAAPVKPPAGAAAAPAGTT